MSVRNQVFGNEFLILLLRVLWGFGVPLVQYSVPNSTDICRYQRKDNLPISGNPPDYGGRFLSFLF